MYEKEERERDSASLIWMRGRWMSEYIYTCINCAGVFMYFGGVFCNYQRAMQLSFVNVQHICSSASFSVLQACDPHTGITLVAGRWQWNTEE